MSATVITTNAKKGYAARSDRVLAWVTGPPLKNAV